jgi:hypothetical protein
MVLALEFKQYILTSVSMHGAMTTMYVSRDKNSASRRHLKSFLGKTAGELTRAMGEPFASYSYRDGEIYLYDSKPVKTVAFHNGLVVKCDDLTETRKNNRVQPLRNIPVFIQGEGKRKGLLKDISTSGAAVTFTPDAGFAIGDFAVLTVALPIDGTDCFLEIPCRVKDTRISDGISTVVFLLNFSGMYREKRLLARYISLRITQAELDLDDSFLWKNRNCA